LSENRTLKNILISYRGKEHTLPAEITVGQALKRLQMSPESYLVVRNGELVTEDQLLHTGDKVRIIPVISGGSTKR